MALINLEVFFNKALGYSESQSSRLAQLYKKSCFLIGATGGAGLAVVASKSLLTPMQAAPSKSRTLATILIGAGVGFVLTSGACAIFKLQLEEFIGSQTDLSSAIGNCKGDVAKSLRIEADKLLRMGDQIDKSFADQEQYDRYSA